MTREGLRLRVDDGLAQKKPLITNSSRSWNGYFRQHPLVSKTGIPSFHGQESAARSEATKIMNSIREKNTDREISIVVEYMVGNVRDTIQHMVNGRQPPYTRPHSTGSSGTEGVLECTIDHFPPFFFCFC